LFLGRLIPYSSPTYRYNVETGGHKYIVSSTECTFSFNDEDKMEVYSALTAKDPELSERPKGVNWLPNDLKISSPKIKYTLTGRIRKLLVDLGMLSLFASYPLYLLVRFIIWAIKTLKEK